MNVPSAAAEDPADEITTEEPAAEPDHEQDAIDWLENVYQGDKVRQLSVRAIITGMVIGAVMSISNLYVGLKTGWGLGVTITACIIAYSVFTALEAIFPKLREQPFTILENYTMSSAASAAGYMASAGLVSAMPALYLTTGRSLVWWEMMSWLAAVSFLGVFMAIPLKRQLINIDKLPFPTGIATAETLRSMHTAGADAVHKAKALFAAGAFGALIAFWRDGLPQLVAWRESVAGPRPWLTQLGKLAFPETMPLGPGAWLRGWLDRTTVGFEGSLIMIAAGAIMGIRVGISLLVGAIIFYPLLGQWLMAENIVKPGYRGIVSWTLWPATAMMVTSGLLSFAMRWRTVLRSFQSLAAVFGGGKKDDPLAAVEVPGSWFVAGTAVSGLACVVLGHFLFGITWWMGCLAVLMTFLLSIVAARATGETDVTPIGAMGKITQLMYGVVAPSNITVNLMTASITSGAASHSADLLTDLKSGYLLGGNPRYQTISQLFGVTAGALVCVPVYAIIVDPKKIGSAELPAPAAKVWASVAEMLANGLGSLPPYAVVAMIVGGVLGIAITLAETYLPHKYAQWVPSATGLGIAGVIPAFNSISMFIGALAAWILARSNPKTDAKYTIAVSSGLIAGESLMGVAIILIAQAPQMWQELQKLLS